MSAFKDGSRVSLSAFTPIGLRELLDATPDLIFASDAAGRIQWLNPAVEAMTGYPTAELLGRPFAFLLAPETRVSALRAFVRQRLSGTAELRRVVLLATREGGELAVEARVRCFERHDGEISFVGVARALPAGQPVPMATAPVPEAGVPTGPAPVAHDSFHPAPSEDPVDPAPRTGEARSGR